MLAVRVVEVMDYGPRGHFALLVAHGAVLSEIFLLRSDGSAATEEILRLAGSLAIVLLVLPVGSSMAASVARMV